MLQIFWDISPFIHFSNSTPDISQISRKVKLQRKPCTLYTSLNIRNHWDRLTPWYHKVSLQQIQWMFGVPCDCTASRRRKAKDLVRYAGSLKLGWPRCSGSFAKMAVLCLAYGKKMGKVENTRVLKCVQASRLYFLEGIEKWVSSTQLSSFGCLWPGYPSYPRLVMWVKRNWCPRLSLGSMILVTHWHWP